jgi:hypothetical protein
MGGSCAVWANASATIGETTRNAEDSARIVSLAAMYWASQYDQEFARKSSPWCAYPNDSSEHARTVRMRESRVGEDDRGRLATPFDQRTIGSDHLQAHSGNHTMRDCPRPLSRAFFGAAKPRRRRMLLAGRACD